MKLLNLLEPEGLVHAFMNEPPEDFVPLALAAGGRRVHSFLAELDLLTTADKAVKDAFNKYRRFFPAFIERLLRPKVLFIGTTVSEYVLFPEGIAPGPLRNAALSELNRSKLQFLIVKDIPLNSPLISYEENRAAEHMISHFEGNGFFILCGQALAYVPVDFGSVDEYLQRLSRSRRKDLRRKLRSSASVSVEEVRTGDRFFSGPVVDYLYELYLNVYRKSEVHFDKLTAPFFREVLTDGRNGGIVFLYRTRDKIIGFNLCFVARGALIDKYVGFLYPDSHDFNLYFVSWFYNLNFCIRSNLKTFVAGWTDPEIKSYLGADFTYTCHAVYVKNPLLRFVLSRFKSFFESDRHVLEDEKKSPGAE